MRGFWAGGRATFRLGGVAAALAAAAFGATAASASPFAYVSNFSGATVSQYDSAGGGLSPLSSATATTGANPKSIAVTPDGQHAYIPNFADNTVSQFSVGTDGALTPLTPATVAAGAKPGGAAVSPDGGSLYVANQDDATVSQYTIGADGKLTPKTPATVATGTTAAQVAVSSRGPSVYVTSSAGNTVSQYTIGPGGALTPKTTATVATGSEPEGLAVSPDGSSVYVANFVGGNVSQFTADIDGALTAKTPATVAAGSDPFSVAVTPDGANAYVTNEGANSISQFSADGTGALTAMTPATVSTGATPAGVVVSPDGGSVYAANFSGNSVSQYTVGSGGSLSAQSPATVAAGSHPIEIAFASPGAGPGGTTLSAPSVTTGGTSSLTGTSVTLLGNIDPQGQPTTYRFSWGTDPANETLTPVHDAGSSAGNFVAASDLSGLQPGTTYHYHLEATNATGTTQGDDHTFVTPGPSAVTETADGVDLSSATLHGTVNPHGEHTTFHFEYGQTKAYGSDAPSPDGDAGSGTTAQSESTSLTGLNPSTTYHYRLVATNPSGTSFGSDQTFTTAPAPPAATTQDPASVTKTDAKLLGAVDPGPDSATYSFQYADDATYDASGYDHTQPDTPVPANCVPGHTPCIRRAGPIPVSEQITGLAPGTVYHFRLVAKGPGGTATTDDKTFRTVADPPDISISPPTVTGTGATIHAAIDDKGAQVTYQLHYTATLPTCNAGASGATTAGTGTIDQRTGAQTLPPQHGPQRIDIPIDAGALGTHFEYAVEVQKDDGSLFSAQGAGFDTQHEAQPGAGIATNVSSDSADLVASVAPREDKATEGYFFKLGKDTRYADPGDVGMTVFDAQWTQHAYAGGGLQGGNSLSAPYGWDLTNFCPRVAKEHVALDPGTTYHFRTAVGELDAACPRGGSPNRTEAAKLECQLIAGGQGLGDYGPAVLSAPDPAKYVAGPDQKFTTAAGSTGGTVVVSPSGGSTPVSCEAAKACNGKLALVAGSSSRRVIAAAAKPIQLGLARFRIPAHRTRKVKIKLTKAGRRAIAHGVHRAKLILTVRSGSGRYSTTTRTVRLARR